MTRFALGLLATLVVACAPVPAATGTASRGAQPLPSQPAASAGHASEAPGPSASGTSTGGSPGEGATTDDPLLAAELVDVRTGEAFTLADLASDGPIIVETMAIWCTNCRQQMREVTAAHELAEFGSVSIDVEPTELPEDLAAYAEREGFDWPFVLADAELATLLRDRFGTEVLFPPGMPKLLVLPDGGVELLPLGELLTAAEIADLVGG